MVKQLKNRYSDPGTHRRFVVGVDRSKMRLTHVDDAVDGLMNDRPVMDNSKFTQDDFDKNKKPNKFDRSKFKDFK